VLYDLLTQRNANILLNSPLKAITCEVLKAHQTKCTVANNIPFSIKFQSYLKYSAFVIGRFESGSDTTSQWGVRHCTDKRIFKLEWV